VVRITGGILKGRKLLVPKIPDLRPTTDMVRESVFNILRNRTEGARILDLFAGTGALGIEALSRGAVEAVFVEKDRKVLEALKRNLASCGVEAQSRVIPMPAEKAIFYLEKRSEKFDLIFLDPPYHTELASTVLDRLSPLVDNEGLVILEHDAQQKPLIDQAIWVIEDSRRFGRTMVCFLSVRR
jgi:16S rRNA (guanine966-N2)-methyltransferase